MPGVPALTRKLPLVSTPSPRTRLPSQPWRVELLVIDGQTDCDCRAERQDMMMQNKVYQCYALDDQVATCHHRGLLESRQDNCHPVRCLHLFIIDVICGDTKILVDVLRSNPPVEHVQTCRGNMKLRYGLAALSNVSMAQATRSFCTGGVGCMTRATPTSIRAMSPFLPDA